MSGVVELDPPVCDFRGGYILTDKQLRPAREEGRRCYP